MSGAAPAAEERLARGLAGGRVHSAYLLSGTGERPRTAALAFARALACSATAGERPCEACAACRRSRPGEPIALDGKGKAGPLYRQIGDHPDLFWLERGADSTRISIGQVRALQRALHLRAVEGGRRAVVIADAEWLNPEAQNALLRVVEEPPPDTHFLLVAQNPASLLATLRSRCQRVAFPPERRAAPSAPEADPAVRALSERLAGVAALPVPALLDFAEEYRGARAAAAEEVGQLVDVASAWLHERACAAAREGRDVEGALAAFATAQACRRDLLRRNANGQMTAERLLLALRAADVT